MQVAVYTIALNEEAHAKRWADNTKDADYRLVLDTGSIDQTRHLLKVRGVQVEQAIIKPFRFDTARNIALALLPPSIDWCIVLDMDEHLEDGWRAKLDDMGTRKRLMYHWRPGPETEAKLLQQRVISGDYQVDPNGEGPVIFWDDRRVHRRFGYQWRYPCHEEIYVYGGAEDELVDSNLHIYHLPDHSKSRSQYLDILEPAARYEYPHDGARMLHYYARELCYHGRYDEAVDLFRQAAIRQMAY